MFILLNKCFKLSNNLTYVHSLLEQVLPIEQYSELQYVLPLLEQVFPIEQQSELSSFSFGTSVSNLATIWTMFFLLWNKCLQLSNNQSKVHFLFEQVFPINQQSELCLSSCLKSVSNWGIIWTMFFLLCNKCFQIEQQSELCLSSCVTSVSKLSNNLNYFYPLV